jgi:hypothetical protein
MPTRPAALALLLLAACAAPPPSAPAAEPIAWSDFRWVPLSSGGRTNPHAAIFVPIQSEDLGGTYWLQLDTGAEADLWIYRAPLAQLLARTGVAYDSTRAVRVDGRIGAYPLRQARVQVHRYAGDSLRAGDPFPEIGTLGLDFFRGRVLLLDLPRRRFAILDSAAALPPSLASRVAWTPAVHRNGKLFVPLTAGGRTFDGFFYDSGASLFPLVTTPEVWRQITGRAGDDPSNTVVRVPSFGETITLKGAPVPGRVSVGAAALDQPLAFYLADGPRRLDFGTWGFPVTGLFGNALFADRYLVIVDLPHARFGLVESR